MAIVSHYKRIITYQEHRPADGIVGVVGSVDGVGVGIDFVQLAVGSTGIDAVGSGIVRGSIIKCGRISVPGLLAIRFIQSKFCLSLRATQELLLVQSQPVSFAYVLIFGKHPAQVEGSYSFPFSVFFLKKSNNSYISRTSCRPGIIVLLAQYH